MMQKIKRARKGCSPSLAPIPHKSKINKELNSMLPKNQNVSKTRFKNSQNNLQPSWMSFGDNSQFGNEIAIAANPDVYLPSQPIPLFTWLRQNKLNADLYKALDMLCPLFPLTAYGDIPSIWASPPPSGASNTVGVIFGRDNLNQLRIIGTNFMSDPANSINSPTLSLFEAFDLLSNNSLQQSRLIENEISSRMTDEEFDAAKEIEEQAFAFRVMPVYLMAIDGDNTYLAMGLAKAYPLTRTSNMNIEFAGEIL
jgi:hypothetical protein